MKRILKSHWVKLVGVAVLFATVITLAVALPASAHDQPDGAEWIMADWMFITFAVFAGGALLAFVIALKMGMLSNLEDAKYQVLTIEEPDYYSGSGLFLIVCGIVNDSTNNQK